MEIDFKNECMAGDAIESLATRVDENTNGTGVIRSAPYPSSALRLLQPSNLLQPNLTSSERLAKVLAGPQPIL